jgi:hypothetical protein
MRENEAGNVGAAIASPDHASIMGAHHVLRCNDETYDNETQLSRDILSRESWVSLEKGRASA